MNLLNRLWRLKTFKIVCEQIRFDFIVHLYLQSPISKLERSTRFRSSDNPANNSLLDEILYRKKCHLPCVSRRICWITPLLCHVCRISQSITSICRYREPVDCKEEFASPKPGPGHNTAALARGAVMTEK